MNVLGLKIAIPLVATLLLLGTSTVVALEVTLDAQDQRVLKDIADIEKAAGMTQHILAWAPLVMLATSSSMVEFTFSFATTDFVEHAQAISAMDKIKSCSISQAITLHLLDVTDPAKTEFFEAIQKPYDERC